MIQKIFFLAALAILLTACIARETYSSNFYVIHNESSEVLFYKPADDVAELTISPEEEVTLDEFLSYGKSGFEPDLYFDGRSVSDSSDITLTKDSMGVKVVALLLNSKDVLDWEKEVLSESRNNATVQYILNVTDDMIK